MYTETSAVNAMYIYLAFFSLSFIVSVIDHYVIHIAFTVNSETIIRSLFEGKQRFAGNPEALSARKMSEFLSPLSKPPLFIFERARIRSLPFSLCLCVCVCVCVCAWRWHLQDIKIDLHRWNSHPSFPSSLVRLSATVEGVAMKVTRSALARRDMRSHFLSPLFRWCTSFVDRLEAQRASPAACLGVARSRRG